MLKGYFHHLSFLDYTIIVVGLIIFLLACHGTRNLKRTGPPGTRTEQVRFKNLWVARQRIMTVITDLLPLAGLLGTALAILNTFLALGGSTDPSHIIPNFAPGLTTTISGIGFAMVNSFVLQAYFNPALEQRFGSLN
jgi:hypothetical protein